MKTKKNKLTKQKPTSLYLIANAIELTESELLAIAGGFDIQDGNEDSPDQSDGALTMNHNQIMLAG